ncbi:hypothetical protein LAJ19_18415 (plasmid) [Deinococcus taeanensis]|uniref:hypothetical protein n=1 Tax=Deinococcus taeanensis TaxID=2737050 RepID=UPI001CDC24B2|nr:hypothetical protein [Deinococcus taeanensis]UBV45096.1 hypothetical protein LAJ19_18415 [Deinococcus taeanensis]
MDQRRNRLNLEQRGPYWVLDVALCAQGSLARDAHEDHTLPEEPPLSEDDVLRILGRGALGNHLCVGQEAQTHGWYRYPAQRDLMAFTTFGTCEALDEWLRAYAVPGEDAPPCGARAH